MHIKDLGGWFSSATLLTAAADLNFLGKWTQHLYLTAKSQSNDPLAKLYIFLTPQKSKSAVLHKQNVAKNKSHTCYIDINYSESSERNRSDVLRSNPEREKGRGLVVQRLGHQDGRGAVFAVWGKVETNWHVGFGDHPILQVVRHPRVAQLRRRLDCLNKMRG